MANMLMECRFSSIDSHILRKPFHVTAPSVKLKFEEKSMLPLMRLL